MGIELRKSNRKAFDEAYREKELGWIQQRSQREVNNASNQKVSYCPLKGGEVYRDMSTSTTLDSLHCSSDYCNCLKVISIILDCSCCLTKSSKPLPKRRGRRQVFPSSGAFGCRSISALKSGPISFASGCASTGQY